jgi:hypothetical protein
MELRSAAITGNPDHHIVIEPDASEVLADTVAIPRGRTTRSKASSSRIP